MTDSTAPAGAQSSRPLMGFAIPVSGSWATPQNQLEVARRAEQLGYASVWTFQRLLYPAQPADPRWIPTYRSVVDPIVTLGFVAAATSRVRLGLGVVNMPFFSPIVLAKQLATLDLVSGGRLDVGLGLGWSPEEYTAAGAAQSERGRRAEEFIRCLHALWAEGVVQFQGEFFAVPPAYVDPKPVQRPHPPLLLGGFAPAALDRAGRLTEGWISSARADMSEMGDTIRVVREAARTAGRDPDGLRFVCRGSVRVRAAAVDERRPLTGSIEEIRGDVAELAAQGVTEFFVDLNFDPEIGSPDADPQASMRRAREALEGFAPAGG